MTKLPSPRTPDPEVQETARAAIQGWGPTIRLLLIMIVPPIVKAITTAVLLLL